MKTWSKQLWTLLKRFFFSSYRFCSLHPTLFQDFGTHFLIHLFLIKSCGSLFSLHIATKPGVSISLKPMEQSNTHATIEPSTQTTMLLVLFSPAWWLRQCWVLIINGFKGTIVLCLEIMLIQSLRFVWYFFIYPASLKQWLLSNYLEKKVSGIRVQSDPERFTH